MLLPNDYEELRSLLTSLALAQPRILAMFLLLPIFNRQVIPGLMLWGISTAFGILIAPMFQQKIHTIDLSATMWIALILKEVFIGFSMGYLLAIPFWIFESVGSLIDNQRGASIASTLNPLTGHDSSPLGILCNQAFIVFFVVAGGFFITLDVLYESFILWDIFDWHPNLIQENSILWLNQLDRLMRLSLLLAAPALIAMFLAELGLALISRFTPQLQVFFMAMSIKSALAILVFLIYSHTFFEYAREYIGNLSSLILWLQSAFGY